MFSAFLNGIHPISDVRLPTSDHTTTRLVRPAATDRRRTGGGPCSSSETRKERKNVRRKTKQINKSNKPRKGTHKEETKGKRQDKRSLTKGDCVSALFEKCKKRLVRVDVNIICASDVATLF